MTDLSDTVRARAEAVCAALVAGDVEPIVASLSEELRRNLGEVMALLPLPAVEATVERIDRTATGAYVSVLAVIGEIDRTEIQTRWKDREGEPRIVEVSNLSRAELGAATTGGDEQAEGPPADVRH